MFQLLPCSRCQRTFSVRGETSDAALLKCPNCGNQFRLGELLDAFYAPWQVLEDPAASHGISASFQRTNASTELAPQLALDASTNQDVQNDSRLSFDTSRGLSLDGMPQNHCEEELRLQQDSASQTGLMEEAGPVDWSKFKPITYEEFERIKRGSKSGFWSTVQVFLGGAAAIPVTLLLLWYAVGKDVAGAGPAVAKYVPWIVPEKFRSVPFSSSPSAVTSPNELTGVQKWENVETHNPWESGESSVATGLKPEVDRSANSEKEQFTRKEVFGELKGDGGSSEFRQPDGSLASLNIQNESTPTSTSILSSINSAKARIAKWNTLGDAKDDFKAPYVMNLMNDLSSVGSFLGEQGGSLRIAREQTEQLSRMIKDQGDLAEWLRRAADAHLRGAPRPAKGWALVCTIGNLQEESTKWRIMVADADLLSHGVPAIEIPKSIAPRLMLGQKLLLLGRLFDSPGVDAPGHGGAASRNSDKPAPMPALFLASFSHSL